MGGVCCPKKLIRRDGSPKWLCCSRRQLDPRAYLNRLLLHPPRLLRRVRLSISGDSSLIALPLRDHSGEISPASTAGRRQHKGFRRSESAFKEMKEILTEIRRLQGSGIERRKKHETPEQSDYICEECRQIDFEKVLHLDAATLQAGENSEGILIARLPHLEVPVTSGCHLCQIFETVSLPASFYQNCGSRELRAFSYLKMTEDDTPSKSYPETLVHWDLPTLAVLPQGENARWVRDYFSTLGHLFCQRKQGEPPGLFRVQLVPSRLEYCLVRDWLNTCNANHKRLCGGKADLPSGLKLIDCSTLRVKAASQSCVYAALSYVWSNSQKKPASRGMSAFVGRLSTTQLPEVVLDAIKVTQGLGIRFLWVDKYCINQDEPSEQHHQISQMDAIYRRAEITIVAAAGKDENFGLPGVGVETRNSQPVATLKNISIVSTMTHPHQSIKESKWWTRGWTYQEAVLSRRRLVFTKDQVYFECNTTNCYESIQRNFDLLQTTGKDKSLDFPFHGILSGRGVWSRSVEESSYSESMTRYLALATDYTSKDLSFEEDSLRAFLGIIKHVSESNFPIRHLWGVPFVAAGAQLQIEYLIIGLIWRHRKEERHRRHLFPSRSWAGWAGAVVFPVPHVRSFESELKAMQLEFESGAVVDYLQLTDHSMESDLSLSYPKALHFEGWILAPGRLDLALREIDEPTYPTPNCTVDGISAHVNLSKAPEHGEIYENLLSRKWEVIVLGIQLGINYFFMIVENDLNSASRVGVIWTMRPRDSAPLPPLEREGMTKRTFRLI